MSMDPLGSRSSSHLIIRVVGNSFPRSSQMVEESNAGGAVDCHGSRATAFLLRHNRANLSCNAGLRWPPGLFARLLEAPRWRCPPRADPAPLGSEWEDTCSDPGPTILAWASRSAVPQNWTAAGYRKKSRGVRAKIPCHGRKGCRKTRLRAKAVPLVVPRRVSGASERREQRSSGLQGVKRPPRPDREPSSSTCSRGALKTQDGTTVKSGVLL